MFAHPTFDVLEMNKQTYDFIHDTSRPIHFRPELQVLSFIVSQTVYKQPPSRKLYYTQRHAVVRGPPDEIRSDNTYLFRERAEPNKLTPPRPMISELEMIHDRYFTALESVGKGLTTTDGLSLYVRVTKPH